MCWLYVPGLEGLSSESTSLAPEVVSSVTWRGKLQALPSWRRAWKTATYLRRLSGLTLPPSTLAHGVASWIASLQDSPASPGLSQASGSARKTSAGSGQQSRALFAWLDRASSSWKMSQGSLFEDSDSFSVTWPRSGSMRNGECLAQPLWVPPISASESSFWPTARDHKSGQSNLTDNSRPLNEVATRWHTPRAAVEKMGAPRENDRDDLQAQARGWPTPRAGKNWPTPDASVSEGYNQSPSPGAAVRPALARLARTWGTPRAAAHSPASFLEGRPDPKTASPSLIMNESLIVNELLGKYWRILEEPFEAILGDGLIIGRLVRMVKPNGETLGQNSGQLNPEFVRWLMGFPTAWTNFGPSGTEWCRWLQQSRLLLSQFVPRSGGGLDNG